MNLRKTLFVAFISIIITAQVSAQDPIKLYPYRMNPINHPEYSRHYVKGADASLFGNKIQFTGLRDLMGDYKSKLNWWVDKNKMGNIIWASYPVIYRTDLKDVVSDLKKRGLYLFDLYGYIPGSGPGGYWQQFVVPKASLQLFEQQLGDHWLGMDNGEQDGRYVGSFAPRLYPMGTDRIHQYLNFQHHFEKMGDLLGNRMATLVSLNFGHYFLKEGVYTMIGAETAQGLPNSQIYYSFIRGAGKQYGVSWFGNASVWNRWGWKVYEGKAISDDDNDYNAGSPLKGTSLSLLKRLLYTHVFYNCLVVGFEGSMQSDQNTLSPIGKIQQEAVRWVDKFADPGTMYTPVALMTDFFAGWSFPRHFYSNESYKVWGNLPYEKSDYMTDNMLNVLYPDYQNASYYRDERGFITPTPYGDMADCLLSDAPLWLLNQYPVLVVAGELKPSVEVRDKLQSYVESGGHLIITAGSLRNMSQGIAGVTTAGENILCTSPVTYQSNQIAEDAPFALTRLSLSKDAKIIQKCGDIPAIIEMSFGKGKLSVIASPFAVAENATSSLPALVKEESPLNKPYPMLHHVQAYLQDIYRSVQLFEVDPSLSMVTCIRKKDEYSVLVTNSSWHPCPLQIKARTGRITSVKEIPINEDEIKAIGNTPKTVHSDLGQNTRDQIMGGGVRCFVVKTKNMNVQIEPEFIANKASANKALFLRDLRSLKEAILLRPTFFEHFDRAVVDWKYIEDRDIEVLKEEAGWLSRQKLKISVDLTSGLNLFPDLRIVNNDSTLYKASISRIKKVIDKMTLLHADELIISSQRSVENNYTMEKFNQSLISSYQDLSDYCAARGVTLLYRPSYLRVGSSVREALDILAKVGRSNFVLAPSMSLLLDDKQHLADNLALLKAACVKHLIVSALQKDIHQQVFDFNLPISRSDDKEAIKQILEAIGTDSIILDGLYSSQDEEYGDLKIISNLP